MVLAAVLHDDGKAAGAFVLEQDAASGTDGARWYGLPRNIIDGQTIVARRDLIEINLLTLLDALSAHATAVGAGGRAVLMAALITPSADAWSHVAVVTELVDDVLQPQGWRLASARAHQSRDLAIMAPVTHEAQLADMRDTTLRLRAAYRLAAELLAMFSIDQPAVLKDDGTLDSDGAGTSRQQLVYQHARHLGLPVDAISPIERRLRFDEEVRLAKERLRQR